MKPAPFEYHRPGSIEEVLDLLERYGEDCRILAGGQSLVPLMNMRMMSPVALISVNHCAPLDKTIQIGDRFVIAARARQAAVGQNEKVRQGCRLLYKAMPFVGTASNRNRGTVCGSLAHNDPSAELPAVAMALDAQFVLSSRSGQRTVSASEFLVSELMTCMEPNEFLEEVHFPVDGPGVGAAFVEVGVRAHGFAIAGVAVQVELDESGCCRQARIAGMGFGGAAVRFGAVEDAIAGSTLNETVFRDLATLSETCVDPISDVHADASYRRTLAGVLVVKGLREAMADAGARVGEL